MTDGHCLTQRHERRFLLRNSTVPLDGNLPIGQSGRNAASGTLYFLREEAALRSKGCDETEGGFNVGEGTGRIVAYRNYPS